MPDKPERGELENVDIQRDGDKLVITVDMSQRIRRTKDGKGKSMVIATTNGFHVENLEEDEWMTLQIGKKE